MNGLIGWVLTGIATAVPLWLWIVLAIAAVFVVYRLLGLRASLGTLGIVAVWLAIIFGEDRGRQFQIEKDTKDADKLIAKATAARARANANSGISGMPDNPKFPVRDYRD